MEQATISVIIPVYNNWELTAQCLRSLKACTQNFVYEVIVVDNASTDATVPCLDTLGKEMFGEGFRSIHLPENRNFGPACNLGAQLSRAPFLFFLNNDTILTENWLPPLLEAFAKDACVTAVGPQLLYPNDTVQHVGVAFTTSRLVHIYSHFPRAHPAVGKMRRVQALTGAALLVARVAFFAAGGFYEGYRNGFEDVDLCLHMLMAGNILKCVPQSIIYHLESQTPGRNAHEHHNALLLRRRCGNMFHPDVHIHGVRDGFQAVVADNLDITLTLTPAVDAELFAQVQGQAPSCWRAVLSANPLWIEGRKYMADLAEKEGQYSLAIALRSEIATRSKCVKDFAHLLTLEKYATPAEKILFAEAKTMFESLTAQTCDLASIKRKLRDVRHWNDNLLTRLYEEKFTELQQRLKAEA